MVFTWYPYGIYIRDKAEAQLYAPHLQPYKTLIFFIVFVLYNLLKLQVFWFIGFRFFG